MRDLRETVKACQERLDKWRRPGQRIGEQNTKAMLIDPVLAALGWDLFDPEEVNREYRRRPSDNPVDYALLLMRTPRLFVEAKGLGENIDDPRWANQTISYAAVAGVEWVALTDGAEWRIYNAHAPVPVEDKLFRAVRLGEDADDVVELLELLSKDNMRENRLQELWQGFFVDRQVYQVLTDLFTGTEPPRDLVNLVAKRIDHLPKPVVRDSLIRARATFDFPVPVVATRDAEPADSIRQEQPRAEDDMARSAPSGTRSSVRRRPQPKGVRQVSKAERRLKVADLLRMGWLRPGPLTAAYDGRTWTAELHLDSTVEFAGSRYSSLSAAGTAVKISSRGSDLPPSIRATDGWSFWSATNSRTGQTEALKQIRRQAASASQD